ncbi:MAG TPA: SGNH/GDSL hydrolase family protein [Ktedonobacterales bacterium]|jgi:lysophospholipase L1-like esterase
MKRYGPLLGALCVALALSGCVGATAAAPVHHAAPDVMAHAIPTEAPPRPPRVDFLGDSLTWGLAATTPAQSFAALVTDGVKGARTGYDGEFGNTAQLGAQDLHEKPAPTGIDIFVIEWGTNDVQPPDVYQANYRFIVQTLRAANPSARIVCLRPWQDPNNGYQPAYWHAIQAECGASPAVAVDLAPLYLDMSLHGPGGSDTYRGPRDWFHPNDAGHAAVAQAILAALAPPRTPAG